MQNNPKNLTDQELNEWVAERFEFKKVGGSYVVRINSQDMLMDAIIDECGEILSPAFDPCKNLNHTHLMEEKIREMGEEEKYFERVLWIIGDKTEPVRISKEISYGLRASAKGFAILHASARRRCEAAYLALDSEKELKSDK